MIHRHERATPIIVRIPQTGSSTASPSRSTRPPLSKLGEDLRSVPEVFRFPVLIIDFDTGCANNILGIPREFNRRLPRRHDLARWRPLPGTAAVLRNIQRIMASTA